MKNSLRLYVISLCVMPALFAQTFLSPDDVRFELLKKVENIIPNNALQMTGYNTLSRKAMLARVKMLQEDSSVKSEFVQEALSSLEKSLQPTWAQQGFSFDFNVSLGTVHTSSREMAIADLDASANPLLDDSDLNAQARLRDRGTNTFLMPRMTLGLTPWFNVGSTMFLNHNSKSDDFDFDFQQYSAVLHVANLNIEIGKNTFHWGAGRIKSLNFSGNHASLYSVRIANDEPLVLPGFLKHLGPVRHETFVARLDDERLIKNPYLVGHKLAIKPTQKLEMGMSYTVMLGGKGAKGNNPLGYIADSFVDESGVTNRNFIVDARYEIIPEKFEFYSEFMVEDCCPEYLIDTRNDMNLFGVHMADVDGQGKLDFTLEFVRTSPIAYRHGTYKSGYKNDDRILGHNVGPDSKGLYAQLRYFWSDKLWLRMNGSVVDRGEILFKENDSPTDAFEESEIRYHIGASVEWSPQFKHAKNIWLASELTYEHADSFDFKKDQDRHLFLAGVVLKQLF